MGVILLRKWIQTDKGRHKWDAFMLKPPIFGPLVHKVSIARFSHTLASLTQSGVPIMASLDIVSGTAGNRIVGDVLLEAKAAVREGRALADALRENPEIIPPLVTQMVEVGEQTGALDNMLHKVGEFYDGEVENTVNNLTSLLEPILTVVMGVMVGFMVICMYLPMFDYIKHVPTGGNCATEDDGRNGNLCDARRHAVGPAAPGVAVGYGRCLRRRRYGVLVVLGAGGQTPSLLDRSG